MLTVEKKINKEENLVKILLDLDNFYVKLITTLATNQSTVTNMVTVIISCSYYTKT